MPQFKDEHIAIIAPGSHTTLAQLGLPESFTPPQLRVKSRMFASEETPGQWDPHKIRSKKPRKLTNGINGAGEHAPADSGMEIEPELEEDFLSDDGAVWPIESGRITNWGCFFALLQHVYNTLSPPFHTPILLVAEPAWTVREREKLTQFFFEQFKPPGFAMIDAASAACFAYGIPTACVVDVGASKANVTAVVESAVDEVGRSIAIPKCGGDAMTARLLELLQPKGFTYDMCEQLKKSSICEVLPPGTPLPGSIVTGKDGAKNLAASTGAEGSHLDHRHSLGGSGDAGRGLGHDTDLDEDMMRDDEDNEGVVDVASIVARGKMNEFLARKEREKAEKAERKKKSGEQTAAAQAKAVKLKNAEREQNSFYYEDYTLYNTLRASSTANGGSADAGSVVVDEPDKHANAPLNAAQQPEPGAHQGDAPPPKASLTVPRREISVGVERLLCVSEELLATLSTAVHRTILATQLDTRRAELWESIIIVGSGSSVRGFKEALLATLQSRFLISPSSATIFTSELPSNLSTPLATGANTPQPQSHHANQHGGGVNPLLLAATSQAQAQTSASGHLHPGHQPPHVASQLQQRAHDQQHQTHQQHYHSSHGQTPASIKLAKLPEYFPEWKETGSEEAAFLGAQVAAKIVFLVDSSSQVGGPGGKGWISRSEYNELGPSGIHECVI